MPRPFGRLRRGVTSPTVTPFVLTLIIALALGACDSDREIAGPEPDPSGPAAGLLESAVHLKVDLKAERVEVVPSVQGSVERSDGLAPSLALLGKNEIGMVASNFSRTTLGLGKIRIRFDLKVVNKLAHSDLVTPTFPAPPAGVTGVLLFPFRTLALGSNGQPLPLAELRAKPSVDWNGTGSPGSGAPHNFFNSATCLPVLGDDCFRWESFGTSIAAGATTAAHTVGFDVDPLVASVDVYVVLAADIRENALTGAIGGTVTSTLFGPLQNALVTVSPGGQTGTSDAAGNYLIGGLLPGSKTLGVTGTPTSCFRPASQSVLVTAGTTSDVDFNVICRRIVYARFLGGPDGEEIYVINADGSGDTRLTTAGGNNFDPSWSPDGSKIVYHDDGDLVIMNADGSGRVVLTGDPAFDIEPAWSPDGTKIVFSSFRAGISDLWVINADGTGQTQLTTGGGAERDPSWSPDGTRLTFTSTGGIYVMNASPGSTQTKITNSPFGTGYPAWSPDGSKIAFAATTEQDDGSGSADHAYEIYTMNPDGSGVAQITHDDFFDLQPAWSPDGSRIVYSSYAPGTPSLRVVAATGVGGPAPLTSAGEGPSW